MMRYRFCFGLVAAGVMLFISGCRTSEEENRQEMIELQLKLLTEQVQALDEHGESMKKSIKVMYSELEQMEKEINRLEPRLHATRSSLVSLHELTSGAGRESDIRWTIRNFSISTQVLLWVLVLWLFYRVSKQSRESTPAYAQTIRESKPVEQAPVPRPAPTAVAPSTPPKPEKKTVTDKSKNQSKNKNKGCKVKGCPNKHRSKGFCNKHYQQWRRGTLEEEIEE